MRVSPSPWRSAQTIPPSTLPPFATSRTAGFCDRAGGGLPPRSFILVLKSNTPKGPRTGLSEAFFSRIGWPRLLYHSSLRQTLPTCSPTPPKCPRQGHRPPPLPSNRHTGPTRPRQWPSCSSVSPHSGCRPRPQMRQAAACGKPGVLLAPPRGG